MCLMENFTSNYSTQIGVLVFTLIKEIKIAKVIAEYLSI